LSNVMSGFIIGLFDENSPMTIPYVCAFRHLMDIPSLYMIFMQQKNFYISIAGYFMQQIIAKGWTAPALLMLKTVVDPRVASLSIGIFLFTVNIDYSVALFAIGKTTAALGIYHKPPGTEGPDIPQF